LETTKSIDVRAFLDERPVGSFLVLIAILTCSSIFMDGMDVSAIAFAVPEIIREWGVSKQQMAPVVSSVFIGLVVGALIAGPVADEFGRKWVIVISVFAFGTLTALAATSTDLKALLMFRLLAGVGLGAALPNTVTLMAEYAPARRRALFVTLIYSGFTIGATAVGFVASWLIPFAGWRIALGSSGALPIVLSVVLALALPESALFLAAKGRNPELTRRLLRRVDPTAELPVSCAFSVTQPVRTTENPLRVILSRNYLLTSVCLWVAYFTGVFVAYCVLNWMPLMAREAGFDVSQSAIITSMFTLSGPVGSIAIGAAMDRVKPAFVLAVGFLLAAFVLWLMSQRPDSYLLLRLLCFALGFFAHGAVTGLNALSAKAYPTTASATGVSWMQGWGRTGGIASAFAGGLMLSLGWRLPTVLVALGLPLLIASLALVTLGLSRSISSRALGKIPQGPVRTGQTTF